MVRRYIQGPLGAGVLLLFIVALGAVPLSAGATDLPDDVPGALAATASATLANAGACTLSAAEQAIAQAMQSQPEQQRRSLSCHPTLVAVARARAEDMARRGYFGHTNPDGIGPNFLVRQAGYHLPRFYPMTDDANTIESIMAGAPTPDAAWSGWMRSPGHRAHLLGLNPHYADQVELGIGHASASGSGYRHYWVVITAQPGP